jgi:hypothetical protein
MHTVQTWLALAALAGSLPAIADAPSTTISAGPVFTRGEEAGAYPSYPDIEVQIEVPPGSDPALLAPGSFRLAVDDGAPVSGISIRKLESTGYGIAVSVSLDVSGSMRGAPLNAVRSALIKYVDDAGPQDKIAIETIADDSRWDASWGDSRDQVKKALTNLATRGSLTRLWDGLLDAIAQLPATPLSQRIIVISDGHDEGSRHSIDDVIAAATRHSIIIDAVGVTRSNPKYLEELRRLADRTGGQFRQARQSSELEQLVSGGIGAIKNTPVVGFRLNHPPADGRTHHLQVTWNHGNGESTAEMDAILPVLAGRTTKNETMEKWLWPAVGAAAVLLLLIGIVTTLAWSRKPKAAAAPAKLASPPVADEPVEPGRLPLLAPPPMAAPSLAKAMPASGGPGALEPRVVPREPAPAARRRTEIYARFPMPAEGQPAAWLLCEEGIAPGKRFAVDKLEYWIGSLDNNHLHITTDPTVSGNHACLVFDHDVLGIYDHRSTNGTLVNGQLLRETRQLLRPGDQIRIGRSTFRLQGADENGKSL